MTEVATDFLEELGVHYLSSLAHLHVEICCVKEAPGRVEALKSTVAKAINLHPNSEIKNCVSRFNDHSMYKDDRKWVEVVAEVKKWGEDCREEDMEMEE
jgi:hypothetical protein